MAKGVAPQNPKTVGKPRIIWVIIAFMVLLITIGIGIWYLRKEEQKTAMAGATLHAPPPTIKAIPGVGNPSEEYIRNIRAENLRRVQLAAQTEGASVPTIVTRPGGPRGGEKQDELAAEAAVSLTPPGCDPKELERARQAGVKVDELRCKGCTPSQLHASGYTAGNLLQAGVSAKELQGGGYSALQLKEAGYSAKDLKDAEYDANELRKAGYSAAELRLGGYTAAELKSAGYKLNDMRAAGFTAADIKTAGYPVAELKEAGYSAANLRKAGFNALDLSQAGYTPAELIAAGYSDQELLQGNIPMAQISSLRATLGKVGVVPKECSPTALTQAQAQGISAEVIKKDLNCSPTQLKAAGYSAAELKAAGFMAEQLKNAGFTTEELKLSGLSAKDLHGAGISAAELKDNGFSAGDLMQAGFTPADLIAAGFTAEQLRFAGVDAQALKTAGIAGTTAKAGGYSDGEMLRGGYPRLEIGIAEAATLRPTTKPVPETPFAATLLQTGASVKELKDRGYTVGQLREAGVAAADLKNAGFTVSELRASGLTAGELMRAGFTSAELTQAGYPYAELQVATSISSGANATQLKAQGLTAVQLRMGGVPADQLKAAGFNATQLKQAGFTAGELTRGGFTQAELQQAGYTSVQLGVAGIKPPAGLAPAVTAPGGVALPVPTTLPAGVTPVIGVPTPVPGKPTTVTAGAPVPSTAAAPAVTPAPTPAAQPASLDTQTSSLVAPLPDQDQRMQDMLEKLQVRQEKRMSQQQRQDLLKAIEANMAAQAGELFASWAPPPTQQYVESKDKNKTDSSAGGGPNGMPGSENQQQATAGEEGGTVIKAGTIMFGTLDTGINSDEQSPILATIVQGPLKGSKLLGQFSRVDKKVVLSFNVLSVPSLPNSMTVNAVAIDADTARTAISSDVDNHYLLRYGTLFASSFVAGLGEAVLQSGSTTVDSTFGTSTTQNPTTSATEKGLIALGNVGNQYSRILAQNFNRPPTVKVESGTGIGILLMSDLNLPVLPATK